MIFIGEAIMMKNSLQQVLLRHNPLVLLIIVQKVQLINKKVKKSIPLLISVSEMRMKYNQIYLQQNQQQIKQWGTICKEYNNQEIVQDNCKKIWMHFLKLHLKVEKMIALAITLEFTTKNINENISKVSKTVQDVEEKSKKVEEMVDKIPSGNKIHQFFFENLIHFIKQLNKFQYSKYIQKTLISIQSLIISRLQKKL